MVWEDDGGGGGGGVPGLGTRSLRSTATVGRGVAADSVRWVAAAVRWVEGRTGGWILGISDSPQAATRAQAPASMDRRRARRRVRAEATKATLLELVRSCMVNARNALKKPGVRRGLCSRLREIR